jgi:AcrR family transcriptional regulator
MPRLRRPPRKRPDRYHHGDLRAALIQAALRTIQTRGVEALTLRGVGEDLGVSRTALYRHFTDKSALLAAVAAEGFRTFHGRLVAAWEGAGRGRAGFEAQGLAYIRFAIEHPSSYRVMFGGFLSRPLPPDLATESAAAFQALVDAILEMQRAHLAAPGEPLLPARFAWATVHGIAMLAIDGVLAPADAEAAARFAVAGVARGIAA